MVNSGGGDGKIHKLLANKEQENFSLFPIFPYFNNSFTTSPSSRRFDIHLCLTIDSLLAVASREENLIVCSTFSSWRSVSFLLACLLACFSPNHKS